MSKQRASYLFDGKVLQNGVELNANLSPYVITEDEKQAKEIYGIKTESDGIWSEANIKVICGKKAELAVSENWASFCAVDPTGYAEFNWYTNIVSEFNGVIVYSFDNLFKIGDERTLRRHWELCSVALGVINHKVIQEDGKMYMVAVKTIKSISESISYDDFLKLFMFPVEDASMAKVTGPKRKSWTYPMAFHENEMQEWKLESMFEQSKGADALFGSLCKPKFIGGSIEVPNHEQIAILMASGAFNNEMVLRDGRIVSIKGTERVNKKSRVKYDTDGKPKAFIEQKVRNTEIMLLDLTNDCFQRIGVKE